MERPASPDLESAPLRAIRTLWNERPRRSDRRREMEGLPPGPRIPAVGQLAAWAMRPVELMKECRRRYGDTFTLVFPGFPPQIFFSHPDAIKDVFTGDPEALHAGESNAFLEPLVGKSSLLLLDGRRHLLERKLMLPPFHGERMYAYGETMRQEVDRAIARWPNGRPFPIHPEMQSITMNVILRTVFGIDEGAALVHLHDRVRRLLSVGSNPLWLLPWVQVDLGKLTPWGEMMRLRDEIDGLLFAEIRRRRVASRDGRTDILSLLLEAKDEDGRALSDAELRDEMVTLLVAGHETTATALGWAFHHVLKDPAVLSRLTGELRAVANGGPIGLEHLAKLEYLDAVVKETLRLLPVIPAVGRLLRAPTRIGGWTIPAGTFAVPCIYLAHHRPEIWTDPDRFHPERFIDARPSPYEFLPFGGGVRRCIGMSFAMYEMKVVLLDVLSRVSLQLAPRYRAKVVHRSITFAPSGGVPVVIERKLMG